MSASNRKKKSLYALTKPALIKKCKQYNLPTYGTKKDMIARIMHSENNTQQKNKTKGKKKKQVNQLIQSTTSSVMPTFNEQKQNHPDAITTIGDRVKLKSNIYGTVEYIGNIKRKTGIFYGIKLDKPKGTNNGSINNIYYFKCKPKTGIFVTKSDIINTITKNNKKTPRFTVGDTVKCIKANCNGIIRFIGIPYSIKQTGIYYGIELDKPLGKNNGTVKGRKYFKCKNKYGIFIKSDGFTAIDTGESVEEFKSIAEVGALNVMTWNIAGINNNPWEYYVSVNDKNYKLLMNHIESFLTNKGKHIKIKDVLNTFGEDEDTDFFDKLSKLIEDNKILSEQKNEELVDFNAVLENDVNKYLNISVCEFLSNRFIGEYRLISWPDRLLNTMDNDNGTGYIYRPTAINYYSEIFKNSKHWFELWIKFMNNIGINVLKSQSDNKYAKKYVKFGKFGDNKVFLTLNIVLLAIFDAILIYLLFDIQNQTKIVWQTIKQNLYNMLNKNKFINTINILNDVYNKCDILFIQEVRNNFIESIAEFGDENTFMQNYNIIFPSKKSENNQNSIICLKKTLFNMNENKIEEITNIFYEEYNGKVGINSGDLIAIKIENLKYILISFHGDTGGLATHDILTVIHKIMIAKEWLNNYKLIIGIDANTYYNQIITEKKKKYSVKDCNELIQKLNMNHCFDNEMPIKHTTNHPRTYLQPQLNKAVKREDIKTKYVEFRAPKDFIIFNDNIDQFELIENSTIIDNTGEKEYNDNVEYIFPSQYFPSDHAIISASFKIKT